MLFYSLRDTHIKNYQFSWKRSPYKNGYTYVLTKKKQDPIRIYNYDRLKIFIAF
jgi:hypothetical protein